jgi:hypothetical protein
MPTREVLLMCTTPVNSTGGHACSLLLQRSEEMEKEEQGVKGCVKAVTKEGFLGNGLYQQLTDLV